MATQREVNSTEAISRLRAQLQAGQFARVYLVMGEQDYLRTQSRDMIRKALVADGDNMNTAYYTGDNFTVQEIMDLAETLPFFADRRVITIENSWLFDARKASGADPLIDYLPQMPETTHIILVDGKVDRSRRLYKTVKRIGTILECSTPSEADVSKWVMGKARAAGTNITRDAVRLLIEYDESDLLLMKNDIDKLAAYCQGREAITGTDVEEMCTRQIGDWVFDLIAEITARHTDRALGIYLDLLKIKTPPQVILSLLIRNYNQLLQADWNDSGMLDAI